jgi:cobalt-zinc-cadmium efflux system membrane fusion protein
LEKRVNFTSTILIGASVLALFILVGCESKQPVYPVEQAPYELIGMDRLRVRADLIRTLQFGMVESSEITGEIAGFGHLTFAPGASSAVRVPFNGYVENVNVDVGEVVKENQILAVVRSGELAKMRAEIRRINAELDASYEALRRNEPLVENGSVAQRTVLELRSKIGGLEAERSGIQQAIKAARGVEAGEDGFDVLSPRSGQVIVRNLDPGEQVDDPENQPAFIIADPERLIVRASFPERDSAFLRTGSTCRIEIPSLGQINLPARVYSVVGAIEPKTRTVQAVCVFDKFDPRLRAEMLAQVTVDVKSSPRPLVPRSALLLRRDVRVVFVKLGHDQIERRKVTIGSTVGSKVEIIDGLQPGEEVVIDGAVLLDGELDRLL